MYPFCPPHTHMTHSLTQCIHSPRPTCIHFPIVGPVSISYSGARTRPFPYYLGSILEAIGTNKPIKYYIK